MEVETSGSTTGQSDEPRAVMERLARQGKLSAADKAVQAIKTNEVTITAGRGHEEGELARQAEEAAQAIQEATAAKARQVAAAAANQDAQEMELADTAGASGPCRVQKLVPRSYSVGLQVPLVDTPTQPRGLDTSADEAELRSSSEEAARMKLESEEAARIQLEMMCATSSDDEDEEQLDEAVFVGIDLEEIPEMVEDAGGAASQTEEAASRQHEETGQAEEDFVEETPHPPIAAAAAAKAAQEEAKARADLAAAQADAEAKLRAVKEQKRLKKEHEAIQKAAAEQQAELMEAGLIEEAAEILRLRKALESDSLPGAGLEQAEAAAAAEAEAEEEEKVLPQLSVEVLCPWSSPEKMILPEALHMPAQPGYSTNLCCSSSGRYAKQAEDKSHCCMQ